MVELEKKYLNQREEISISRIFYLYFIQNKYRILLSSFKKLAKLTDLLSTLTYHSFIYLSFLPSLLNNK